MRVLCPSNVERGRYSRLNTPTLVHAGRYTRSMLIIPWPTYWPTFWILSSPAFWRAPESYSESKHFPQSQIHGIPWPKARVCPNAAFFLNKTLPWPLLSLTSSCTFSQTEPFPRYSTKTIPLYIHISPQPLHQFHFRFHPPLLSTSLFHLYQPYLLLPFFSF